MDRLTDLCCNLRFVKRKLERRKEDGKIEREVKRGKKKREEEEIGGEGEKRREGLEIIVKLQTFWFTHQMELQYLCYSYL